MNNALRTVGFIGVGKIASAIVEGLARSDKKYLKLYLSPRNEASSTRLAAAYPNVHRLAGNQEVLDAADIIIIALRPAIAAEVLKTVKFSARHTVISLIPLLKYDDLLQAVSPATDVSRAIPLPSVIQHNCPIPLYKARKLVTELFSIIGQPLQVADEQQLHAIWTLTGLITPFYEQMEVLSDWSVSNGVDRAIANAYIANMYQSLAYMAQQEKTIDFHELASHAATPNGMNEQAGKEIREKGAHEAYRGAADRLLERFK
jgi:pyrroline-5-carboxylate reductase